MKTFFSIFVTCSVMILFSCSQDNKTSCDKPDDVKVVSSDTLAKTEVKTISAGEKIFVDDCVTCHGLDGKKKHSGAKDLSISILNIDEIVKIIKSAQTLGNRLHAPRFPDVLTDDQIKDVAEYIMTLRK